MNYPINNNITYDLRDITKEIEDRLGKEGKVTYLPVEESQKINDKFKEEIIKAKREHLKNQTSSRRKSMEIIFNA